MSAEGIPLTVTLVRSLAAAAFQALELRKQEINDLNVYPVPDGDTGTNLALTMRSILDAVNRLPERTGEADLCSTVTQAALMGARGNSGVILSQIVRGAMAVLGEGGPVTVDRLSLALRSATETAYRAVRRPVEGTMLTVLKDMARAAVEAPRASGLKAFMEHVVAAGWKSVERTPSLLKVLADAGVVDAGGYGLVVLVEGATKCSAEWLVPIATRVRAASGVGVPGLVSAPGLVGASGSTAAPVQEEESEYTYCTSFLLMGDGLDQAGLEEELSRWGDSLLVVGDSSRLKVHVHTDHPGEVLALATKLGVLTEIEIDNMDEQMAARNARFGQAQAPAHREGGLTQVVAVVVGEGNKALFRSLGVDLIVDGGQSMNPSAEDLLRAVEEAQAPAVIILPNNSNIIMTAEQTVGLTSREVHVLPSKSIQAGLAAAVAFDRRQSASANLKEMLAALENVASGEVTRAVRESVVDGVTIRAGDYIGLWDGRVTVSSPSLERTLVELVDRLLAGGKETLTVLLGEGEEAALVAQAVDQLRAKYRGVEIEVHEGGQPYYPVLLAAE